DEQVPSYVSRSYSHTARGLRGGGAPDHPPPNTRVRRGVHPRKREPEAGLPDGERHLHLRGERDRGVRGCDPEPLLTRRQSPGRKQRQLRGPVGQDGPGLRPRGHGTEVRVGREGRKRRGCRSAGGRPGDQGRRLRPLGDLDGYRERHRGLRQGRGER
ncbi:Serine--glyoxylate aminotransferase, partial [uncultured Rubrobacteraceae bacterium]